MPVKSILCIFYFCLVFLNKHFQTVYEFVFGARSGIRLGLASKEVHSHYCQIDEISAILLKRSGKNYFLAEEVDSGTALKKVAGKYFFEFCREISKLLPIQELGILFF